MTLRRERELLYKSGSDSSVIGEITGLAHGEGGGVPSNGEGPVVQKKPEEKEGKGGEK
jgi:hypothetical protein